MPFLSESDRDQLQQIFRDQLQDKVRLRVLTRPPSTLCVPGQPMYATCGEAEPLVRELAATSDRLEVVVHDVLAREVLPVPRPGPFSISCVCGGVATANGSELNVVRQTPESMRLLSAPDEKLGHQSAARTRSRASRIRSSPNSNSSA